MRFCREPPAGLVVLTFLEKVRLNIHPPKRKRGEDEESGKEERGGWRRRRKSRMGGKSRKEEERSSFKIHQPSKGQFADGGFPLRSEHWRKRASAMKGSGDSERLERGCNGRGEVTEGKWGEATGGKERMGTEKIRGRFLRGCSDGRVGRLRCRV